MKKKNEKSNFCVYFGTEEMPEEIENVFNSFPNIFSQVQVTDINSAFSTKSHKSSSSDTSQNQPIPSHPRDNHSKISYNSKNLIVSLIWTFALLSLFTASVFIVDKYLIPLLKSSGFSEIFIAIIYLVLLIVDLGIGLFVLYLIKDRMNKKLPQYLSHGTVVAKKVMQRRITVGKVRRWHNYCCLSIAIDNNECFDFETPSELYNSVIEGNQVKIVYNKLSSNEFLIVKLIR